jgi:hypothetical protein
LEVSFIITRRKPRNYLNHNGFLLPYSLMLLMIVLMAGVSSTSLFLSKYHYLTNMGKVYERNASIAHSVLLGIENSTVGTVKHTGNYGMTETITAQLNEQEMVMEITFQSSDKVFQPVSVVYNKETKHIIDWK